MISKFYTNKRKQPNEKLAVKFDPQRHRVYQLEREFRGNSINVSMSRKNLLELARHMCDKWKVPPPKLKLYRSKKDKTMAWCSGTTIALNMAFNGGNLPVLCHEMAHWVLFHLYPEVEQDHGPEFMDVYADLMEEYKVLPRDCLLLLAERYSVEVGTG